MVSWLDASENGPLPPPIEPYYQDELTTIYHGDCREILPTLLEGSIDVVLTDPPFFMPATHYQSRVKWQRSWSDTSVLAAFWRTVTDDCVRILKETGHFFTFCNGDSYPVFYPEMYRNFDYLKSIVWDKGHVGLGRVWRNQHELIIAARWKDAQFVSDGVLRADVVKVKATRSKDRNHPVEKPVEMLRWLLEPTMIDGAIAIDPFMGGGSTLVAASEMGKHPIGIEGEERYCEIAAKRLSAETLTQTTLV